MKLIPKSVALKRFFNAIKNKKGLNVNGTKGSERAFLLQDFPCLYIAQNITNARSVYEQFLSLNVKAGLLTQPLDSVVYSDLNAYEIMQILSKIATKEITTLVVTANFLMQRLPSLKIVKEHLFHLNIGDNISQELLVRTLIKLGYKRNQILEKIGDFTVKGDIIDIYDSNQAIRVDLGFDNIESIYLIDNENQRNKIKLDSYTICPLTMFLNDEEDSNYYNLVFTDYINQNICDYFSLVAVEEPLLIMEDLQGLYESARQNISVQIDNGLAKKEHLDWYTKDWLPKGKEYLTFCNISKSPFYTEKDSVVINTLSVGNYLFNQKLLVDDIKYYLNQGYKITCYCGNVNKKTELQKAFSFANLLSQNNQLIITDETLANSVGFIDEKLLLIGTSQLTRKKAIQKTNKTRVFYLPKVGDYVVHENHGIGLCKEIKTINFGSGEKDYFILEYQNNAILYLPSEQVNEISQYLGGDNPKLNQLGDKQFARSKEKAKASLKKLAFDLRKIYLNRSETKGFKYPEDDELMTAFENGFAYELTSDQALAVAEIKNDMQKGKVMDRLLCGDVGYGKTEVALITAYKHILSGKQVAFIAPTTILSMQHYATILQRMEPFMVSVALLNRFTPPAEVKRIKQGLKDKTIDIVCGTHKLLAKDVEFQDLGLLILDEEQRFGVNHKEKLKNQANLNVLSMSATPIPRTLHISMSGIRDISIIATPPNGRLPINTIVTPTTDQIVLDACKREFNRNGQVLIINNRVEDIMQIAQKYEKLLNTHIEVAHGQMDKHSIEKAMLNMYNHTSSVLLATSLIENGIDLPNANTLIVLNSDKFGLSQLYQMRGRVGRSKTQAYAYFTYKNSAQLTSTAKQRLEALKEFNELGSGFKIAMRDLELRGAGTILGAEQSGHIEKVGYDLYQRLLKEVVDEMDGKIENQTRETKIIINKPAKLLTTYVTSETERIRIYNEIAVIDSESAYQDEYNSIKERYGELPIEVERLLKVSLFKNLSQNAKIKSLSLAEKAIISFYDIEDLNRAIDYCKQYKPTLQPQSKSITFNLPQNEKQIDKIILEFLINFSNNCC